MTVKPPDDDSCARRWPISARSVLNPHSHVKTINLPHPTAKSSDLRWSFSENAREPECRRQVP